MTEPEQGGAAHGGGEHDPKLSHATIRSRAMSGAALVAGRGVALLVLAVVANAVLAHLLSPRQFGLVAFGLAIMTFASSLADGGLGSALIRSSTPIDTPTLKSVFALELTVTTVLFVAIAVVSFPFFGLAGQLTALMALTLPLGSLTTPVTIVLERNLDYRVLARVELLQALVYYSFSVTAVAAGLGVWGLASATVVRTGVSVVLLYLARRDLFFLPLFSYTRIRPLLRFGLNFQATSFVNVVRDQGMNIGIAAIAGTATLGVWTLARRLLELPMLLFQTLWRVSFPAMSQLVRAGSDVRSLIERGAKVTSIGSGFVLATVAAASPGLVPAIFGGRWHEAGTVVPIACAGLLVPGPISVATAGFLYAAGDAGSVLVATIAHTAVWLAVSLLLLPSLGVIAIPIGWAVGSAVDMIALASATYRHVPAKLFRSVARPTVAALAGGGAGILFSVLVGPSLWGGFASALIALAVYSGLLLALERAETAQLVTTMLASVRAASATPTPAAEGS